MLYWRELAIIYEGVFIDLNGPAALRLVNLKFWADVYHISTPADDMQGHQNSRPGDHHAVVIVLQDTATDVKERCSSDGLQLNAINKTELLWYGTATNFRKLSPADKSILIRSTLIESVPVVHDLGVSRVTRT